MYFLKIHRLACIYLFKSASILDGLSINKMCTPEFFLLSIFKKIFISFIFRDHIPKTAFFSACSLTTETEHLTPLILFLLAAWPHFWSDHHLQNNQSSWNHLLSSDLVFLPAEVAEQENMWLEGVIHLNFQNFRFLSYDMDAVRWKREWAWEVKQMQTWGLIVKQFTTWCSANFREPPNETSGISTIVNTGHISKCCSLKQGYTLQHEVACILRSIRLIFKTL